MDQSEALYANSPALAVIAPWMEPHLPVLDAAVKRRVIQLVAGVFDQCSVVFEEIAASDAFPVNSESARTQVQRIVHDTRITLEAVYYPFVRSLLTQLPGDVLYLTLDETSHGTDYCVAQIGWATDGMSIPLGFFLYAPDAPWADGTRQLIQTLNALIPDRFDIVLLADRVHTGEPFLACLDEVEWNYVFRANEDTQIEDPEHGWREVRQIRVRNNKARYFSNVRVWKGSTRRANLSIYQLARKGFRTTTWYVLSNLPAAQERFAEYACRWWTECTFRDMKSAYFAWERGRVTQPKRVLVLLIAVSCALWALWLLGRAHERIPKRQVTNRKPQTRRCRLIKQGRNAFREAVKARRSLTIPPPPAPRVLDYPRSFFTTRLSCAADCVELW